MASRRGLKLVKNPRRDPGGIGFGAYMLLRDGTTVASFGWDDLPSGDRLADVEQWLAGYRAANGQGDGGS